jgi:hypothetical protein
MLHLINQFIAMISHLKNLRFFAAILALTAIAIPSAHAQSDNPPSNQFGLGFYVATGGAGGLDAIYAINKNVQVGTIFNLDVTSPGTTTFQLSPLFRYQFNSTISPFVSGGFTILVSNGQTAAGLFLGGGLAYYFNTHFGIHTDVDIIGLRFSPSLINFGWTAVRVGGEWYF